jgi:thiamine-phosphate pyrophosphorylase
MRVPNNTHSPGARAQINRQRLYLVTPTLDDPGGLTDDLESALGATDVAAVLLRLADSGERTLIERAKAVAAVVQRHDVALILDGRPEMAARAGADGAHLSGIQTFATAFSMLKPDRIAGAGGLRSRHDAMLAAETGADYVMFGDPDRHGRRPGFEELLERLTWWTELFEIPCVAYAVGEQEIEPLARTGADFIALGEWMWREPNGVAGVAAAAAAKLAEPAA